VSGRLQGLPRGISLTAEQFRYGFGNVIAHEESDELYEKWSIPAPGKPLFDESRPTRA
jgi:hypothetical protein